MKKRLLTLLASVFLLANCSTLPPEVDYKAIEAANAPLRAHSERIVVEVEADCAEGLCTLKEANLQALVDIITRLNDAMAHLTAGNNKVVDALTKSEQALAECQRNNEILKADALKEKIINTARNVAYIGLCAGGLLYGN